jgi:intracellular sulfur oxidation DsrE/DsrF family protein
MRATKEHPMKRVASVLAVVLALTGIAAMANAADKKEHRIVFQVDQNDPQVMNLVLNNVQNTLDHYNSKNEPVKVEVVAYGPGLNMLRDDKSPVKERLSRMAKDGSFPASLQFSACHNTMMGMEKAEGHPIPVVSEAKVVPSGVVRITELQEDGWSYIRP